MSEFRPGEYSNEHAINNQSELADELMVRLAQTELSPEEQSEFDDILGGGETGEEEQDPYAVDQEDADLPDIDTDAAEMESIKDLIPWDSFVIIFDPHYSKLLEEENGLPPSKAKAKSYYIYFSPENKRLEGVVNKRYIGGYGTKEDLGEDFSFIKTLSEEGFAPEWKDTLLTSIDELPAVLNEKTKEKLRDSNKEVDEAARKEENVLDDDGQDPALNEPAEVGGGGGGPAPVGNVGDTGGMPMAAKVKDIQMRRKARNSILRNELS